MIEFNNKTIWCGNLSEQVTEELLYELFLQAGPLESINFTKGKDRHIKSYAFITYVHEVSVPYALNLFRGTTLFNRTFTMQCRGRLALLPPPIRCQGPEPPINFTNQPMLSQQFANMAKNLWDKEQVLDEPRKRDDDKLVMASLQGNWTHRHHPYRAKEHPHNRDNYRFQDHDNYRNRDKPAGNRCDRRYNKRSHYHRRE